MKEKELREQATNLLQQLIFETPSEAKLKTKAFNEKNGTDFILESTNGKLRIKNGKETFFEFDLPGSLS